MILQLATCRIRILDELLPLAVSCPFRRLVTAHALDRDEPHEFEVGLWSAAPPDGLDRQVRRNSSGYYETGQGFVIVEADALYIFNWRERQLHVLPRSGVKSSSESLVVAVRLLLSFLLLEKGGLLLHSAGLKRADLGGILFIGPATAGKSTIYSILDEAWQPLNDEVNAVAPSKTGYQLWPVAFAKRDEPMPASATPSPVRAIFSIVKSSSNRTQPLSRKEQIIDLVGSSITYPATDHFGQRVLENAASISAAVPVQRLFFRKSAETVGFVESILS